MAARPSPSFSPADVARFWSLASFVTCSDCEGTRLLDGEPCVYCDGQGRVEERQETEVALKARVRLTERLLLEPGFAMAFLFLLDQKAAKYRAEFDALVLGKAA